MGLREASIKNLLIFNKVSIDTGALKPSAYFVYFVTHTNNGTNSCCDRFAYIVILTVNSTKADPIYPPERSE